MNKSEKTLSYEFKSFIKRLRIKQKKFYRDLYQSLYLMISAKKNLKYKNKVDLVQNEFKNIYYDVGPEHGIIHGLEYDGSSTHCNQCLFTLARLLNARNVLEIGSYHYRTANQLGRAIDKNIGKNESGNVITLDIIKGGYDNTIKDEHIWNHRVKPYFWYAYKTDDTKNLSNLELDNSNMENKDIVKENIKILNNILKKNKINFLDLIFLDGDHTYEGLKNDIEIVKNFATRETLIVVDNIWDKRMLDVKQVFDELTHIKWNFKEFNDRHYHKNQVQDTGVFIFNA